MKETDYAYLAGFIDGDGTIALRKDRATYKPLVSIANTNRDVLEYLKAQIGRGTICTKWSKKVTHSESYDLRFEYNVALKIAERCLPYLHIKKERAKTLLGWKKVVNRNGRYTEEEFEKREALYIKMKKLNKR